MASKNTATKKTEKLVISLLIHKIKTTTKSINTMFQRKMACLAIWHYVQCDIGNWNHIAIAIVICSDDDDACIKEREYEREITTKNNQ